MNSLPQEDKVNHEFLQSWLDHPDSYYVRYEKIKVLVASLIMLKIRPVDGMIMAFDRKVEYGYNMHRTAYNINGDIIGSPKKARFLCRVLGILPEKISPKHKMCSIGKSRKDGRWYAFSHRGYISFGIGDVIKKESFQGKYLKLFNDLPLETEDLVKDMAIIFAEAIS